MLKLKLKITNNEIIPVSYKLYNVDLPSHIKTEKKYYTLADITTTLAGFGTIQVFVSRKFDFSGIQDNEKKDINIDFGGQFYDGYSLTLLNGPKPELNWKQYFLQSEHLFFILTYGGDLSKEKRELPKFMLHKSLDELKEIVHFHWSHLSGKSFASHDEGDTLDITLNIYDNDN
jgi:hypothetical protein